MMSEALLHNNITAVQAADSIYSTLPPEEDVVLNESRSHVIHDSTKVKIDQVTLDYDKTYD